MAPGRRAPTRSNVPLLVASLAVVTHAVMGCGAAAPAATLASGTAASDGPAPAPIESPIATRSASTPSAEVVSVSASAASAGASDERGTLVVTLQIAEGFHVMSNRPSRPTFVATEVAVDAASASDVSFGEPAYPEAATLALDGESISIFDGRVVVRVPYEVTASAPGPREIRGKVRYQACARGRCLLPKTVPFAVSLPAGSPRADPSLR